MMGTLAACVALYVGHARALPLDYDAKCEKCVPVRWVAPPGAPSSFEGEIRELQRSWTRLREDGDEMRAWMRDANTRAADAFGRLTALRFRVPEARQADFDRCLLLGSRLDRDTLDCFRAVEASVASEFREFAAEVGLLSSRVTYYGRIGAHVPAYCRINARPPCLDPRLRDEPRVAELKKMLANVYGYRPLRPGEKASAPAVTVPSGSGTGRTKTGSE